MFSVRVLAAFFSLISTGLAAPRLAVISTPENENAAALLTSALSSSGKFEVVERSELEAISREQQQTDLGSDSAEFSRIGQLLGANALVVLESKEKLLSARLISTGPGVTVDEQTSRWPQEDARGWAKYIGHRFDAWSSSLPTKPGSQVLLGLLGIRSATGGYSAVQVKEQTSFLLTRSLMHLPGIFVLERSRMREIDWEKQIASQARSAYWTSGWLLDGSILHQGNKLTFDGRIKSMSTGTALPIKAEGTEPLSLSEAISRTAALALKTTPNGAIPNSAEEAAQFQEEAEWALRWAQFDQAEQATNASWALGNKTEAMGLLRARAPAEKAEMANRFTINSNDVFGRAPDPTVLDDISRALSNLLEIPSRPEMETSSAPFSETAANIILAASQILQSYYYQPFPRTDEENNKLAWIRAQLRELSPKVVRGGEALLKSLDKVRYENLVRDPEKFPAKFYVTRALYAPLWGDTPEQSEEQFLLSQKALHAAPPKMQFGIKDWAYLRRTIHEPLITAWSIQDRSRVAPIREKLLQKLGASADPKDRLDAAILQVGRYNYINFTKLQKMVPIEKRRDSFAIFEDLIGGLKEDLIKANIDPRLFESALSQVNSMCESNKDSVEYSLKTLHKQILVYLVEHKWPGDEGAYGSTLQPDILTPTERDSLVALLPAFQEAHPNRKNLIRFLELRIPLSTTGTKNTLPPGPSGIAQLKPTQIFKIGSPNDPAVISVGIGRGSRFILAYKLRANSNVRVQEIDTITGQQREYEIAEKDAPHASYFESTDEFIFLYGREKMFRVSTATGQVESRAVPTLGQYATDMWLVTGKLWAASGGTIVRIDPKTLDSELIASAQRRPGKTILDDCEPYKVDVIFSNQKGETFIATAGKTALYQWRESDRNFQKIDYTMDSSPKPFDRSLYLSWVGSDNHRYRETAPENHLLMDEHRLGQTPQFKTWPPRFQFPGMASFQTTISARAAVGSRLYASYLGKGDMYLRVMDDEKGKTYSIPIDLRQEPKLSRYRTMIANDAGVLFYDQTVHEMLFFSKENIDKFAETNAL